MASVTVLPPSPTDELKLVPTSTRAKALRTWQKRFSARKGRDPIYRVRSPWATFMQKSNAHPLAHGTSAEIYNALNGTIGYKAAC